MVGGGGLITLAACPLPCLEGLSLPLPVQHLGLGLGVSACRAAQEVGGGYSQEIFLGFWGGGGGGKGRRKAGDSWLLGLPGLLLTSPLHSLAGRTEMLVMEMPLGACQGSLSSQPLLFQFLGAPWQRPTVTFS